jgi:hypothetical protein
MIIERRKCLGGFGSNELGIPLKDVKATAQYLGYKLAADTALSNSVFMKDTATDISPIDFEAEHQAAYERFVVEVNVTETAAKTADATGVKITLESSADNSTWVEDDVITLTLAKLKAGNYLRRSLSNDTHRYLRGKIVATGSSADFTAGSILITVRPL